MKNHLLIALFLSSSLVFGCMLERELVRPKKKYNPNDPVYYNLLGQSFYNDREYEKSIFQYEKLIKKFSTNSERYQDELAWAEYEIGFNYLVMEEYDTALIYFDKVVENYDNPAAKSLATDRVAEINEILAD